MASKLHDAVSRASMDEHDHHPLSERRHTVPANEAAPLSVSVIVPFHANLHQLNRCLASLQPLPPRTEIIVAADRAPLESERVAARQGARVVRVTGPGGPAAARNQAAMESRSDVLIFIDADVVVPSRALHAMAREFAVDFTMAAVSGTSDDDPGCGDFFSQYKNLVRAYVHRSSGREARSFWAGFGGIRAEVFHAVGGFDEGFTRPCIEDIELGDRVSAAGHRMLIDRRLHARPLKRWTFSSMLASDIWDRGVPWAQLIFTSGPRARLECRRRIRCQRGALLCRRALHDARVLAAASPGRGVFRRGGSAVHQSPVVCLLLQTPWAMVCGPRRNDESAVSRLQRVLVRFRRRALLHDASSRDAAAASCG